MKHFNIPNKKGKTVFLLRSHHPACSSVQSLSHVWLFATPWTAACQASLSITNFWSLLKLMSIESVMPSNHLILCRPLLLPASVFPSISVFSNDSVFSQLSVQFSSVPQSCLTLCDPMNLSTPGLPVHHQLPEFTQTHVHRVGDAIQPSHPLLSLNSSHEVAKVLECQPQHQSFQWTPRSGPL